MEARITQSVSNTVSALIEKALKPLEKSLKVLTEKSNEVEKQLTMTQDIRDSNKVISRQISNIEQENRQLKTKLEILEKQNFGSQCSN